MITFDEIRDIYARTHFESQIQAIINDTPYTLIELSELQTACGSPQDHQFINEIYQHCYLYYQNKVTFLNTNIKKGDSHEPPSLFL